MSVVDLQTRKRKRRSPHPESQLNFDLLSDLDWRTREGKFLMAVRKQYAAHVGGNPNSVQKALIERAARLSLYVEMLDARSLAAGSMSDHDQRLYLSWSNALVKCLRGLGIRGEATPPAKVSLDDYVKGSSR
jgi:hypothetical protein